MPGPSAPSKIFKPDEKILKVFKIFESGAKLLEMERI